MEKTWFHIEIKDENGRVERSFMTTSKGAKIIEQMIDDQFTEWHDDNETEYLLERA